MDAETGLALETRTIGVDFGAGYTYSWTTPKWNSNKQRL
ncbi:hypothetical protein KAOT1_10621 [Kordia algicida OT-1]|uniref:Uncharacterized protein n=1 Tax=Kordia algicida OT-1 TaxID=391587 RepID=A9E2B7_9FLAO|nr:hypothetical protein KAOT1_10621 [Kordia algicida OT-1]